MPWEHTGSKIAARHRERLAVVYVRQSTRQQVVGHQESTRLQYALVDRAVALGWEACRVVLIDDDLGKSGSSAEHRVGFQRLVAEISLGHVGLVLGTEMSRLARSGKDWYQLLELCALGGSLLADTDGVYDPTEYNDRLLLGLKGTMSEAELYLINQRMRAGRVNKARRGELAIALPVGYWRHPSGEAVVDPDEQVQSVVRLKANRAHGDVPGAVRFGPALLAGLLRCGRCGRRMTVGYHVDAGRPRISYNCTGARSEWGGPHCQHLSGGCLDAYVAGQVLQVLSPAAVEVHIQAVQQALADRAAVEKVWQQRLERAQQQVDRARRCYRLAEPEHRLVVRQLEQDWEQALAAQRDLQEQWRRFQRQAPQQLSARDQEAIRQAAADLPRLWEAPGVTHADRKEVVRAVLDEITVSIRGVSELVDLTLRWAGGRTTTGLVRRPIQYFEHLSYYPRLQQRVLELAEAGWHPEKIADQLNRDGYQSARADGPIRYRVVAQILRRNGRPLAHRRDPLPIDPAEALRDNEWLLPQLAAHLGCTTGTLRGWLRAGHLTGRQETRAPHRWILLAPPEKVDKLRDRLAGARGRKTRVHPCFAEALNGHIP